MKTDNINLNQKTFTINGIKHRKFLESKDFVYYVNNIEESVYLFRKKDNSLASNNCFAENALYEDLGNHDFTWISREATILLKEIESDNS